MSNEFDVVVIGAGPGGYVCAIKAAQLGLKVACVEKNETLGGTCLNIGCIPSKALLHASEVFHVAKNKGSALGFKSTSVEVDLPVMMKHKDKTVDELTKGIAFLFKKNNVTAFFGIGGLTKEGEVSVRLNGGKTEILKAKNIVIATGSDSAPLPGVETDEKIIVTSTGALKLESVPKKMIVIGGGVIGLEMASVWSRLGSKVTVIEYADRILPGMDTEISTAFKKIMEKQGVEFKTSTKVLSVVKQGKGAVVSAKSLHNADETIEETADIVLLSIGRTPYTANLGLENLSIPVDARGRVEIDAQFRTVQKNVYAIGDAVRGPMLAHKAEDEGVAVAEIIAGQHPHIDYNAIPNVIYTWPEVASVGATEEELKQQGISYKIGKFPFAANGRAKATLNADGFVKILSDKQTDRILGAHIIGPDAGTMINQIAMAIEFKASAEDVARVCHAHPTTAEAMKEASMAAAFGKAIHA